VTCAPPLILASSLVLTTVGPSPSLHTVSRPTRSWVSQRRAASLSLFYPPPHSRLRSPHPHSARGPRPYCPLAWPGLAWPCNRPFPLDLSLSLSARRLHSPPAFVSRLHLFPLLLPCSFHPKPNTAPTRPHPSRPASRLFTLLLNLLNLPGFDLDSETARDPPSSG
jgi:hypothetical protein